MIQKLFYAAPWILLGILLIFIGLALMGPSQKTANQSVSMEQLSKVYEHVEKVHASSLAPHLAEVVQRRVDCFGASPMERLDGVCHLNYLNAILEVGRTEVQSAPKVGDFLINVSLCPVVYSVCMGEKAEQNCRRIEGETVCGSAPDNGPKCAAMEARCIDSVLDAYWRGAPVDIYGSPILIRTESFNHARVP